MLIVALLPGLLASTGALSNPRQDTPQLASTPWSQFRGTAGLAVADDTPFPVDFGPDNHLLWSAALPPGHSSPCIVGDRIVVTGFEHERNVVVCVDLANGAEIWRRSFVGETHPHYEHVHAVPALPTPCSDGARVIAHLGNYGLVALDLDGDVLWERRLPHPGYGFGVGTSPILAAGRVILMRDGAPEAAVVAFNAQDGSDAWRIDRFGFIEGHGTPFLWRNSAREELVIGGTGRVCSFDPKTGAPLWQVGGVTLFNCTTPTADAETLYFAGWSTPNATGRTFLEEGFGRSLELTDAEVADPCLLFERLDANKDGRVVFDEVPACRAKDAYGFVDADSSGAWERSEFESMGAPSSAPGENVLVAIARGGEGDITETHVRWRWKRGLPYVASPLLYNGRLWLAKSGGVLTCLTAKDGAPVFDRERVGDNSEYYMSPVGAAGHVLVGSADGTLYILDAQADGLTVRHEVSFGDELFATPAVIGGRVYVRTKSRLWAFGA